MNDIQAKAKAKSQFNKVASILGGGAGDFEAARGVLQDVTGKTDVDSLTDAEATKFCDAVLNKYGAWKTGEQAEDKYERPVPSRDGSRKAKLNPQEIYERYNRIKAGVPLANVSDDDELQTTNRPTLEDPDKQKRRKKTKTIDDVSREYWERNRK